MGLIFEELIRWFNEMLDENPGEHYTPREVIRLMVSLLLSRDKDALARNHIIRTVYDPCCGSGGMLTIAKERISQINPKAEVFLFGQEVNPETWAVSKADLLMTSADGRDADSSLGDKRREISDDHIQHLTEIFDTLPEGENSKVFDTAFFGYRKITVERPLRLNFQASSERIDKLKAEKAFQALAESRKKKGKEREAEEARGRKQQEDLLKAVFSLPSTLFKDREKFLAALDSALKSAGIKLAAPLRKAILSALSERDETAEVCRDGDGNPEPDPNLRDNENVPLNEGVEAFFDREVKPHVPGAWINRAILDHKDGRVGKVGYEINFNRYFYKYQPPRPLEEIEADIKTIEKDILAMLREVAG